VAPYTFHTLKTYSWGGGVVLVGGGVEFVLGLLLPGLFADGGIVVELGFELGTVLGVLDGEFGAASGVGFGVLGVTFGVAPGSVCMVEELGLLGLAPGGLAPGLELPGVVV
jgi:hypothetical protein